jgi:hypothetical protein
VQNIRSLDENSPLRRLHLYVGPQAIDLFTGTPPDIPQIGAVQYDVWNVRDECFGIEIIRSITSPQKGRNWITVSYASSDCFRQLLRVITGVHRDNEAELPQVILADDNRDNDQ